MKSFYQTKSEFHHKQWNLALETGKEKAAAFHMQEYLNYQEMIGMQNSPKNPV